MKRYTVLLLLVMLACAPLALARGSRSGSHSSRSYSSRSYHAPRAYTYHTPRTYHAPRSHASRSSRSASGVTRNSHGRIARSRSERSAFMRFHPCPSTGRPSGACPGYVVDHVTPLKRGGADKPYNMHWQTKADAKAKDKTE